ncbi:MAG TPA: HD domain-containing protein [Solirubrobacterales bacterium]
MPITSPGIDEAAERSELVRTALVIAREAHADQTRNASGGRPYIDHPVAVAERLAELGLRDEVLAAALLHDVVEDSDVEVADIRAECGEEVAEIVAAMTDDESIESYEARKGEHRGRIEAAGDEAKAIYASDKLTNVEMLRDGYEQQAEAVGDELKVSLDVKIRVWEDDLEMLERRGAGSEELRSLTSRLRDQLDSLSRDRAAAAAGPSA